MIQQRQQQSSPPNAQKNTDHFQLFQQMNEKLSSSQKQTINSYLKINFTINKSIENSNKAFGILLCVQQVILCFIYGFLFQVPLRSQVSFNDINKTQLMLSAIIIYILLYLLSLAGFGLLFAYLKRMIWSSIGFTYLISCLTIQWFFIFNNFVSRFNLGTGRTFQIQKQYNYLYIWNGELNRSYQANQQIFDYLTYGGTLTQAIKCSISIVIGYSAIMGKVGLLQLFLLSFIGTFGYQVNRWIIQLNGLDFGSAHSIFTFGGYMGLAMVIFLYIFQQNRNQTKSARTFKSGPNNAALSLIGSILVFTLIPILTMDPQTPNQAFFSEQFQRNQVLYSLLSIYYCISAAVITCFGLSVFFNGKICIRDLINTIIGGGIVSLSSAFFFASPWPAFLLGMVSGTFQFCIQNFLQKIVFRKYYIYSMSSLFVFTGQTFISGITEAIAQSTIQSTAQEQRTTNLVVFLISAGFGLFFGIFLGIIFNLLNRHKPQDNFIDQTYWTDLDSDNFYDQNTRQILERSFKIPRQPLAYL